MPVSESYSQLQLDHDMHQESRVTEFLRLGVTESVISPSLNPSQHLKPPACESLPVPGTLETWKGLRAKGTK